MNNSWQEQRQEIAVWLSGYLGMVKKWVDRILDNEDHDVDKNKILKTIDDWITYLQDERRKIMMMKDRPISSEPIILTEHVQLDTNKFFDDMVDRIYDNQSSGSTDLGDENSTINTPIGPNDPGDENDK